MDQSIGASLRRVADLSPAQRATLRVLTAAETSRTAAEVAEQLGVQRSSARESLEALRDQGLVARERRPGVGRGRPSWGYVAVAPVDPDGPEHTIAATHDAVATVLRRTHPDPLGAAHEIGRTWADTLLSESIPDHARHSTRAYEELALADHLDKIVAFTSMLGFGARRPADRPLTMELHACPFRRGDAIDPLVCRMHLGMSERIVEETSRHRVGVQLHPLVAPRLCELTFHELPGA